MKLFATIFLAFGVASSAAASDINTAFARCTTTKDDRARLVCFDKLSGDIMKANSAPAPTASGYQTINLADLKVDIKKLVGKKLAVTALIQSMGEMSMLKSDEMDMTAVFANTDNLPRDDRKKLMNGCQMLLCKGTFYGIVRQSPLGLGVTLEKVEWR